jgi:diguanylate cyclase (GGDEF)-like protein
VAVARPGSGEPAATDPETGFELVASWSKWLAEEGARVGRYGHPATIVLVELAGVDRLAERLGPEAADRLIPPIATTMRRHARAADNLARLGRARFGALLTETDEILAINYIERVRAACDVWLQSGAVALRLSIGWAEVGPKQPVDVALKAAETRLNEERQRLRTQQDPDVEAGAATPPAESEKGSDIQAAAMQAVRA